MRMMFVGGSHPRHLFYANQIHKDYPFDAALVQTRGNMLPTPPPHLRSHERKLWHRHFDDRFRAEMKYFGTQQVPDTEVMEVAPEHLESQQAVEFVQRVNPDIVLIFGCGMIRKGLAEVLPERAINLHLGLSPRYRGAATLFWPFFFLEPQWAGCTFHKIVYEPDAGDILHQCTPTLKRGDGIHDVSCKAVIHAAGEMRRLLYDTPSWKFKAQKATGKNFLASDFKAQHLHMIYSAFDNNIVDLYLDGRLPGREPKLVRAV